MNTFLNQPVIVWLLGMTEIAKLIQGVFKVWIKIYITHFDYVGTTDMNVLLYCVTFRFKPVLENDSPKQMIYSQWSALEQRRSWLCLSWVSVFCTSH